MKLLKAKYVGGKRWRPNPTSTVLRDNKHVQPYWRRKNTEGRSEQLVPPTVASLRGGGWMFTNTRHPSRLTLNKGWSIKDGHPDIRLNSTDIAREVTKRRYTTTAYLLVRIYADTRSGVSRQTGRAVKIPRQPAKFYCFDCFGKRLLKCSSRIWTICCSMPPYIVYALIRLERRHSLTNARFRIFAS